MTFNPKRLIIVVRPNGQRRSLNICRERELNDLILKIIRAVIHRDRAVRRMPLLSREFSEENKSGYSFIVVRMWVQNRWR